MRALQRWWHSIFGHASFGVVDKGEDGRVNYKVCGQCGVPYDIAEGEMSDRTAE